MELHVLGSQVDGRDVKDRRRKRDGHLEGRVVVCAEGDISSSSLTSRAAKTERSCAEIGDKSRSCQAVVRSSVSA